MTRSILIAIIFAISLSPVLAETRYVSDTLKINMRSGPSTGHKIVSMLKSGTPLTVLEVDREKGYTRVQTGTREGWVLTRQLMNEPAAKEQLAKALETINVLKSSSSTAQTDLIELRGAHQKLQREAKQLSSQNQKLDKELKSIKKTAANALNLDSENKKLAKELLSLERNHQLLQQQSETLKSRREKDWFIAGAGVLIVGMLMGFIIPKLRFRKKNSWGSL